MGVYEKFKYPGVNLKVAMEMGLKEDEYKNACDILGREPNYIELGVITAMWSEHCSYKSSKKHLKKFPTEAEWVVQGPGENAGIIEVDGDICACFKVESHNHPSYIEPYQGAATGVGGILRDVFTMGARPVCAMNSLRFGPLNNDESVHLLEGVVSGIAGYGNCFGVPTVGGEIYFHETYQKNPLVNAFALGLVDRDKIFYAKAEGKGNPIIYVGAKTGKDGIHGATMASEEFSEESESKRPNVQIGDPFKEKLLLEACLELMQTDYIVGIQDMGAAGLSSSSFEMASKSGTGVNLDLERVPVRETGMTPYEIMLSESQERMLLIAKKGFEDKVKEIFDKWDLDAEVIGKVTDDGFVRLNWHGEEVASLPAESLADDAPVYDRKYAEPEAQKQIRNFDPNSIDDPGGYPAILARMLSNPNIASKRWVYRQYDHMVQTNTVFLPGSDSALLRVKGSKKGIAVSSDCNGRYCFVDPYEGGKAAVLESALNVAVSGARPKAVSDCLNFGNPEKEGVMWQFVRSTDGMSDACKVLNTPVVSGNVSFYNETESKAILPTPTVVMVGVLDDINKRIPSFFRKRGSNIIIAGNFNPDISASEYLYKIHNRLEGSISEIDLQLGSRLIDFLTEAAEKGIILSAHDVSDGGLSVCLAEMCFKEGIGASVNINRDIRTDELLFGESMPLVLLEVDDFHLKGVESLLGNNNILFEKIGKTDGDSLIIRHNGHLVIDEKVEAAAEVYNESLGELMQ